MLMWIPFYVALLMRVKSLLLKKNSHRTLLISKKIPDSLHNDADMAAKMELNQKKSCELTRLN